MSFNQTRALKAVKTGARTHAGIARALSVSITEVGFVISSLLWDGKLASGDEGLVLTAAGRALVGGQP